MSWDSAVAAFSPYLWWKMNETSGTAVTDYGSAGINGTIHGGVTLGQTPGPIVGTPSETAMTFNGSSGYITSATSLAWTNTSSVAPYSILIWSYAATSPVGSPYIRIATSTTENPGIDVDSSSHLLFYGVAGTSTAYPTGQWNMLTITGTAASHCYLNNGSSLGTGGALPSVTSGFNIGSNNGIANWWPGKAAQLVFIPAALTQPQIAALYAAAIAGPADTGAFLQFLA